MMHWLLQRWLHLYEKRRIYKANPCDVDASSWLKPLGQILAVLGSHCKCCSGARVLIALVVGATWPITIWFVVGLALVAVVYTLLQKYNEARDG